MQRIPQLATDTRALGFCLIKFVSAAAAAKTFDEMSGQMIHGTIPKLMFCVEDIEVHEHLVWIRKCC